MKIILICDEGIYAISYDVFHQFVAGGREQFEVCMRKCWELDSELDLGQTVREPPFANHRFKYTKLARP